MEKIAQSAKAFHLRILGVLATAFGVALVMPAATEYLAEDALPGVGIAIVILSTCFLIGGVALLCLSSRRRTGAATAMAATAMAAPASVRAAITGMVLILSFCMLEFSDGLIRQDGRVFYWTSVLFLPALFLLRGLVSGRRWAWWTARIAAAILALWFIVFMALIPFVDLRTEEGAVPWWGRVYVLGVTLLLTGVMICIFRALGSAESRSYFRPLKGT